MQDSHGVVVFHEEQRFRQGWIWVLILMPFVVVLPLLGFGLYQQLALGQPFGDRPMGNVGLISVSLGTLGVPLLIVFLLWRSVLLTDVTSTELRAQLKPFHLHPRVFPLHEIESAEARRYAPISEYGGWGLRMGWRAGSGWAYNVSGDEGVQLVFRDGKRLLIGSQRASELAAAINRSRSARQGFAS